MPRVDHLTGATVDTAPPPCRSCMWWQTRPGREPAERDRFIAETEDELVRGARSTARMTG